MIMKAIGVTRFLPSGIGARLIAGFSVVGVLLAVLAAVSVWRLNELRDQSIVLMDERVPRLLMLDEVVTQIDALNGAARDALIKTEPTEIGRELDRIEAGRQTIGKTLEDLQKSFESLGEAGREQAEAFSTNSSGILVSLIKFTRAVKGGNKDLAVQLLDKTLKPKLEALAKIIRDFRSEQLQQAKQGAIDTAAQTSRIIAGLVVASLILGMLCAVLITRSITRPLGEAVRIAEAVAAGDLSGQISVRRHDEVGHLQRALATMTEQLQHLIADVRQSAEQIAAASTQIASGNTDLSQRTEDQANSVQQTAATVEHLSGAVATSAQTARQAAELAMASSGAAQRGGQLMQQVVVTMGEITSSSQQIANITNVIDGIAFQTNILALNAAVEAARAGEQGRGFAVVASEVRALAQRSADAARQIKSLIAASVQRIETGGQLVGNAGASMQQIMSGAQQVTDLIAEISAAVVGQSSDIGHVNSSVSMIDQATQQNAALVEQSAAAARALQEQAARLVEAVSVFRVAEVDASDARTAVITTATPARLA